MLFLYAQTQILSQSSSSVRLAWQGLWCMKNTNWQALLQGRATTVRTYNSHARGFWGCPCIHSSLPVLFSATVRLARWTWVKRRTGFFFISQLIMQACMCVYLVGWHHLKESLWMLSELQGWWLYLCYFVVLTVVTTEKQTSTSSYHSDAAASTYSSKGTRCGVASTRVWWL